MKTIFLIFLTSWFNLSSLGGLIKDQKQPYLSQNDADKILGQSSKLIKHSKDDRDSLIKYYSTFSTVIDSKTSNLYYSIEKYKNVSQAKQKYHSNLSQNTRMSGQNKLDGIGDEAIWHSDKENFCFIMARKNTSIITIKVNKLTVKTAPDEMKSIVKRLTLSL